MLLHIGHCRNVFTSILPSDICINATLWTFQYKLIPISISGGMAAMSLKSKITGVAVDSFRDYLVEKLEKIKQLDLDTDGQKDVDQITEALMSVANRVKDAVESTDFPKLAEGVENVVSGIGMIGASVDRQKLGLACTELGSGIKQVGRLLQLGVKEMKEQGTSL